jgi:putative ABC transport system permease protein
MDSLWQDLRYGLRGLRNQPAFTLLAALALALGIGATTAIFSVIYNVLLNPFPYKEAARVVAPQIRETSRANQGGRNWFQAAEFMDILAEATVFEEVIANGNEEVLYTTREGTEFLSGGLMSPNTFGFLGVPALIGRTLTPEDAKPGAPPVFVMAHKTWLKYFNLDPAVVGQSFTFNGVSTTCVGVMPKRFTKLAADVYKPVILDRADPMLADRYFMFQARLKPGVTIQQAEAEFTLITKRLADVYPRNYPANKNFIVKFVSWVDNVVGPFRQTLNMLAAAVGLLLLIACTNVANMLLARGTSREKEMAIRASLGASRARLVRQLFIENALLALVGTAAGCVFAHFGLKAIVALIPEGAIPREAQIRLNPPVLFFSLGIAGLTAMLFGLLPALQTARKDLVTPLKDARKGGGSARGGLFRNTLVVAEVALSLVLLIGAGLLMRSFINLQSIALGYDAEPVLFVRVPLPRGQYDTAPAKQQFLRQLLSRVQALPGVTAVTTSTSLPPYGGIGSEIDIPGKPDSETRNAIMQLVSEDYFKTLGVRLLRGRALSEVDVNDARKVIVINQATVTKFFGEEDPIGRRIQFKRLAAVPNARAEDSVFEIIGVVTDAMNSGVRDPVRPEAFMPYSVTGAFERVLMVRTAGNPLALVNTVRREIWALDRNVAVTMTDTLANFLKNYTYSQPRFVLTVLAVFAFVGLALVTLGVYSVIAYTVSRQTHEFGIRMALGATRADVLYLVMRNGLMLISIGVGVGTLVSLALTQVLKTQEHLWQVSPRDPLTLAAVIIVVLVTGLAACFFPARRATRVDPMVALRYD